jgi:hypothetical protein
MSKYDIVFPTNADEDTKAIITTIFDCTSILNLKMIKEENEDEDLKAVTKKLHSILAILYKNNKGVI